MMQRQSDMDKNKIAAQEKELEALAEPGSTAKPGIFKIKVLRARGIVCPEGKDVAVRITLAPRVRPGKGLVQATTAATGSGRGEHRGSPDWGDQLNLGYEAKPAGGERDRLCFEVVLDGQAVIGSCETDADLTVVNPKRNGGARSMMLLHEGASCGTLDVDIDFQAKE